MLLSKLRLAGVAILVLSLVPVSAALVALRTQAQPAPGPGNATPPAAKRDQKERATRLEALLNERLKAAQTELNARTAELRAGRISPDKLIAASRRLVEAQRDMSKTKEDLLTALRNHVARMKQYEKINQQMVDVGRLPPYEMAESTYYRAEAEIWLERAKAK